MQRFLIYILELLGLIGIVGLVAYISWTKMTLGAVLGIVGAFFPQMSTRKEKEGQAKIRSKVFTVSFEGGLRFALVVAAFILIVGAVLDGHVEYSQAQKEEIEEQNKAIARELAKHKQTPDYLRMIEAGIRADDRLSDSSKESLLSRFKNLDEAARSTEQSRPIPPPQHQDAQPDRK